MSRHRSHLDARPRRSAVATTLAVAALGLLPTLALADEVQELTPRHYEERPDDPPAAFDPRQDPLARSPGARPTKGAFTSVQVNVDALGQNIVGDAANEPSIAVDPTAPNRIAIGWRQFDTVTSSFRNRTVPPARTEPTSPSRPAGETTGAGPTPTRSSRAVSR